MSHFLSHILQCSQSTKKGECTRCSSHFCWQPHQDGQLKSQVIKRHVRRNKQKSHKYTAEPTVCPEEWVNAQAVGCFLFLGEDPALPWFDVSVACEQVPFWYYQALKEERRGTFCKLPSPGRRLSR